MKRKESWGWWLIGRWASGRNALMFTLTPGTGSTSKGLDTHATSMSVFFFEGRRLVLVWACSTVDEKKYARWSLLVTYKTILVQGGVCLMKMTIWLCDDITILWCEYLTLYLSGHRPVSPPHHLTIWPREDLRKWRLPASFLIGGTTVHPTALARGFSWLPLLMTSVQSDWMECVNFFVGIPTRLSNSFGKDGICDHPSAGRSTKDGQGRTIETSTFSHFYTLLIH